MTTRLADRDRVLFIGDSITDCDRVSDTWRPLGHGYVGLFADLLTVREPEKTINVVNTGLHRNTLSHLVSRWCDDVLEYEPDVVSILVGINDATRFLDRSASLHLGPEDFHTTYDRLLRETRTRLPRALLLVLEPFFLSRGDDLDGSYRNALIRLLGSYVQAVDEVAERHGATLVPLARIFDGLARRRAPSTYSDDRIHPNRRGHLVIAEAIYGALSIQPGSV
jgi:acyl-CoA thioesterase-1